jgi:hypothetical protein
MKFLTFVWLPFWAVLLFDYFSATSRSQHSASAIGISFIGLFLLGAASVTTIVYAITRIFRRATQDANRRY